MLASHKRWKSAVAQLKGLCRHGDGGSVRGFRDPPKEVVASFRKTRRRVMSGCDALLRRKVFHVSKEYAPLRVLHVTVVFAVPCDGGGCTTAGAPFHGDRCIPLLMYLEEASRAKTVALRYAGGVICIK